MKSNERGKQIDRIYKLITEISSGNLDYRATVTGDDELSAITIGINMLAEEMQATTVSKNYLNRIYKGVVDILVVLDRDFNIVQANETAVKTLGYKNECELVGKPHDVLFMRTQSRSLRRIEKELEKKGFTFDAQRQMRTRNGNPIPVSLSCSVLNDDHGNVNGILYIAKDITRLKRTEDQLRSKNEELNTFIYRASHDLKGPLTSTMGLLELAKNEVMDARTAKEYFSLIELSLTRLNAVLDDFLELGRLTQGSMIYSTINFKVLIKDILESLAYLPDFKKFRVDVKVNLRKDLRSKKNLIKAILHNLIENAFKYRRLDRSDPHLLIEIGNVENEVLMKITDNGIGMNKAVQENIFKMFYRGNYQSEGSGLGLYIVKVSVDALRGRIKVSSKPGEGTTFYVWLPNRA